MADSMIEFAYHRVKPINDWLVDFSTIDFVIELYKIRIKSENIYKTVKIACLIVK